MKRVIGIIVLLAILIFVFSTILFPYVSNFVGWNGYKMWEDRIRTDKIEESKKRKVFVKELNYRIIGSTNLKGFYFKPYLEKGFKVSNKSFNDTRIIKNTNNPYNICYERGLKDSIAIYFKKADEKKLDSFDGVWGYSRTPHLKDTLSLEIVSKKYHGIIKIW
ncbi:hypothetical protein JET18_07060 [Chryseobacterium sp. L7]|uniref:Uncharacterized protein n=1 Tax=Chryseobacterium endalhagicum TaxID=2797638 RepID=A0ABS1QDE2_9FLAO|nr:hypothetical protein [Chryseobacterium endalhagicum]MBL1220591.1 hypothetical protein [Chryseobacterium endalhagicum]